MLPTRTARGVVTVVSTGDSGRRCDLGVRFGGAVGPPDEWISVDRRRWKATGLSWPPCVGDEVALKPATFNPSGSKF